MNTQRRHLQEQQLLYKSLVSSTHGLQLRPIAAAGLGGKTRIIISWGLVLSFTGFLLICTKTCFKKENFFKGIKLTHNISTVVLARLFQRYMIKYDIKNELILHKQKQIVHITLKIVCCSSRMVYPTCKYKINIGSFFIKNLEPKINV